MASPSPTHAGISLQTPVWPTRRRCGRPMNAAHFWTNTTNRALEQFAAEDGGRKESMVETGSFTRNGMSR
eukprot:4234250-Lingulodinium_polyedra.AAC.1